MPIRFPGAAAALGPLLLLASAAAAVEMTPNAAPPPADSGCLQDVQALARRFDPEPAKLHVERAIALCVEDFGRIDDARAYLEDVTHRRRCTQALAAIAPQAPSDRMRAAVRRCVADEGDPTRARQLLAQP